MEQRELLEHVDSRRCCSRRLRDGFRDSAGSSSDVTTSPQEGPLAGASIAARLPAQDLDRARRFYSERLGLEPIDERPGGLLYSVGDQEFAVFASAGKASGEHTQMGFTVPDLEAAVAALRARGLTFERFDFGELRVDDGIVTIPGYYPSKRPTGERAIWFRDSEGNLIGLSEFTYD